MEVALWTKGICECIACLFCENDVMNGFKNRSISPNLLILANIIRCFSNFLAEYEELIQNTPFETCMNMRSLVSMSGIPLVRFFLLTVLSYYT